MIVLTSRRNIRLIHRGEIDQGTGDNGRVRVSDPDTKVRQSRITRENVSTCVLVVLRALDLAPVSRGYRVVDEHERRAGVGDGRVGVRVLLLLTAQGVACGRELPEALGIIDLDIAERAGKLGTVDDSEIVRSGGAMPEVGGEDGQGEVGHDVIEEGLLLGRLDGVELAESQTDETITGCVLDELIGDGGGELDGLARNRRPSDIHRVRTHVPSCSTPVTVADTPGSPVDPLEG